MSITHSELYTSKLNQEFYLQSPAEVAEQLLGKVLVKQIKGSTLAAVIVETEAYLSSGDYSSHSVNGLTKRNAAMFMLGGTLYVYKIYGVHLCVNIVTEVEGVASAVLLRAAEPILSVENMYEYRNNNKLNQVCKGPGNLAKAFNFSIEENMSSFLSDNLFISDYKYYDNFEIVKSQRIGISKSEELLLRYFIKDNQFVSAKRK